jgi:hypothetical protein
MDLNTITQELATLKAQAAKINSDINSAPSKEIKRLRTAEYLELGARIAELKKTKAEAFNKARTLNKDTVKIATLFFPKEQRVQYFATTDNYIDLLLTLKDVFEDDAPAVTSFLSVAPDQTNNIPLGWYELVEEKYGPADGVGVI